MADSGNLPTGDRQQAIGRMFDRIAGRYDLLNALLSARQDARWRRTLLANIPFAPGGRLLDVATGTGDVLLGAVAARPEYQEFIGVDISSGMLDGARVKAGRGAARERCRFELMEAADLRFPDARFDCLTIAFGLRNVVERRRALGEFARVLKPGGVLLVLEFFVPREGITGRLFRWYFHHVLPRFAGLLSDRAAYAYLPESVDSFVTPRELREECASVGLVVDDETSFLMGACRLVRARRV